MAAIKLSPNHFSGSAKVWDKKNGLGSIIRAVVIQQAKTAAGTANPGDFTDNSTGVATTKFVDVNPNFARFNASASGGAPVTGTNTALGKIANAQKVAVNRLNLLRSAFGLAALTIADGTEAVAGTLPALDKSVTATSGTSAVRHSSAVAAAKVVAANHAKLLAGYREIEAAVGFKTPTELNRRAASGVALLATPTITAAPASPNSISVSKAEMDAFLDNIADNIATLAARWAAMLDAAAVAGGLPVVASDY